MTDITNQSCAKTLPAVRRALKVLLVVVAGIVLLFAAKRAGDFFIMQTIRSPLPSAPLRVILQPAENHGYYRVQKFTFEGLPGETVPVMAVIPSETGRRYPAIIFLYGIGMKMGFNTEIKEVADAVTRAGFALFVAEQYNRGERRNKQKRKGLDAFLVVRRRIKLTIQETRRLVDVLTERPDVDPERIYIWGASFGAMTGCTAMAYDPRVKAAVFTVAAGDFQRIVADSPHFQKQRFFSWEKAVAPLAAEILRPFDPIRHIGRIAPRPLFFQNTIQDEFFPRSSVEALYNAAGQPKEIRWYDSPHNRPVRKALEEAVRDGLVWLQKQDKRVELQNR
ncbi:alpha/beta hydrolase family protein [Verrucomicrobiota bacterium]